MKKTHTIKTHYFKVFQKVFYKYEFYTIIL